MGAQLKHGYNSATICEKQYDDGHWYSSYECAGEKLTFNEQAKKLPM